MCLRSFCVTCVELLFISKCVFLCFQALLREKSQHKYTVGNVVMPFNPLTYTEVSWWTGQCLQSAVIFFPSSAAVSSNYSFLSALFCHPLSFHVTMFVVLFLFFFPIQRSNRSQAVDLKLSGALTVAQTGSVCVLFLVCMDCGGRFLDLFSACAFSFVFSFFHLCL